MLDLRYALRVAAAAASLLSFATAALAFSQIDPGEGADPAAKEGIIAVPLPPLEDAPAGRSPADEAPANEAETEPGTPPIDGGTPPDPQAGAGDPPTGTPPGPLDAAPVAPAGPDQPAAPAELPPAAAPLPADGLAGTRALPDEAAPAVATAEAASGGTVEPVRYGDDALPRPVRDLRRKLMEIARAGEVEALRPYLQTGEEPTVLTFGDTPADPIAYLRQASGDGEGAELLAILLEILESGYAHMEAGTDADIYVWPYFAHADLDALTKPQKVELFELVTAGDYEAMRSFGAYNFYRAGISPEGRLEFFVAGD